MPKTIFKYEAFSDQSLKNLQAQSIWFGSALYFNDPYDCGMNPKIIEPSYEELRQLLYLQSKNPLVKEIIEKIGCLSFENFKSKYLHHAENLFNENVIKFTKEVGIACFSKSNSNLLMWAHYGGKYKGFCLEFKTNSNLFSNMKKVNYVKDIPEINAIDAWLNSELKPLLDLFCTKSKAWQYEKEWRIFKEDAGRLISYDSDTLKSIYFGPDMDIQSIEIVCLIAADKNPGVKFWKGTRSREKFEVLFEEF